MSGAARSPATVRLRVVVATDQEDALGGWLWSQRGSGIVFEDPVPRGDRQVAFAYFPEDSAPGADALAALREACPGVEAGALETVPDADWLAPYRAAASPIEIGEGFLVDPREPEEVDVAVEPGARLLLRLPARTAFGVGSHESTRLALELLEATGCAGARVLDVGAGTGILAFAASLLGARQVVAFDVDPAAALLCEQYRRMNRVERVRVFCGSLGALFMEGKEAGFDLALVNVVPAEIGPELARLSAALRPGGHALFSGILSTEGDAARAAISRHGFRVVAERTAGEWLGLATRLEAAG